MDSSPDFGTAGASARREHQRRRDSRRSKVLEEHPHIGRLLLRFQRAPGHEQAWETGALGEEMLAAMLARRCPEIPVLHDRAVPGAKSNIDHLAIAPTGIYVIDAKRYVGRIEVRRPILGREMLLIDNRDKSKLVTGLEGQIEAVQRKLELLGKELPVQGCFCFLNPAKQAGGSGVPLLRTLSINGIPLFYPRKLAKRLNRRGPIAAAEMQELAEALACLLPAS